MFNCKIAVVVGGVDCSPMLVLFVPVVLGTMCSFASYTFIFASCLVINNSNSPLLLTDMVWSSKARHKKRCGSSLMQSDLDLVCDRDLCAHK